MQDRFQALLKRRLRAEIERNPPRFPWETGAFDYDSEYVDVSDSDLIPAQIWMSHIHSLNLPVPLPERVLAQLFEQCRELVATSLQEGAKLVRVVESLFPGQNQALNQLAGLVLSAPPRSGRSTLQASTASTAAFPSHYDVATPAQQMALSLLAAQEILNTMTLRLSPGQTHVQRDWLTDWGVLKLEVEYQPQGGHVRIQAMLPCQGQVCFQNATARSVIQSAESGNLTVELSNLEPNHTYFLEVQLGDEPSPLVFAVCLTTEE
ncbi:PatU [Egbenema bharatensis]|uniref:PatU n=1 Tax=Egbenema bharatensis TaxID=3463334 RepID=UPI003A8B567A